MQSQHPVITQYSYTVVSVQYLSVRIYNSSLFSLLSAYAAAWNSYTTTAEDIEPEENGKDNSNNGHRGKLIVHCL